MTEKACLGCGRSKRLSDFHRHAAGKGQRHPRCKDCRREDALARRPAPGFADLRPYPLMKEKT
jgi:hypothetical protein